MLVVASPLNLRIGDASTTAAFSSGTVLIFSDSSETLWAEIRQAKLDPYISNLQPLSAAFADERTATLAQLSQSLVKALVYVVMFLVSCVFETSVYQSARGKQIAVCRLAGMSWLRIHGSALLLRFGTYALLLVRFGGNGSAGWLLPAAAIVELLEFSLAESAFEKRKLAEQMKGGFD